VRIHLPAIENAVEIAIGIPRELKRSLRTTSPALARLRGMRLLALAQEIFARLQTTSMLEPAKVSEMPREFYCAELDADFHDRLCLCEARGAERQYEYPPFMIGEKASDIIRGRQAPQGQRSDDR